MGTRARKINLPSGLPVQVDTEDPQELRRVINRLLEIIQTWNGESGDPGDRLVTKREFDASS